MPARPSAWPVANKPSSSSWTQNTASNAPASVSQIDRRDADLHRRDDAHRIVHQAQRGLSAVVTAFRPRREPRPPRGHDGVFADHEKRIAGHQCQDRHDSKEIVHDP
jgi:hypothetical protein